MLGARLFFFFIFLAARHCRNTFSQQSTSWPTWLPASIVRWERPSWRHPIKTFTCPCPDQLSQFYCFRLAQFFAMHVSSLPPSRMTVKRSSRMIPSSCPLNSIPALRWSLRFPSSKLRNWFCIGSGEDPPKDGDSVEEQSTEPSAIFTVIETGFHFRTRSLK